MKLGLIGSGFMGRAHALGLATAARVFDLPVAFERAAIADATPELAETARKAWGFDRATGDWRDLIDDPEIGVINITAPNALHMEIALAASAAGKHVYCEKPLACSAADAREMADVAEAAGIRTQVGFTYLANPMFRLAREMIAANELGEIYSYRGIHAEDYMADPAAPYSFRHDPGGGALVDIGSHALATAEFLLGPIARVIGDCETLVSQRRDPGGDMRSVRVDDVGRVLLRFASGVGGSIEANWCATGRTMQHDFAVYGSMGALYFSQERLNEIHYFDGRDASGRRGFRRIEAGPEHEPYGRFCVAPGHQIGFNDLKAIEFAAFSGAIAGEGPEPFNFRAGWRIQHICDAIRTSAIEGKWIDIEAG